MLTFKKDKYGAIDIVDDYGSDIGFFVESPAQWIYVFGEGDLSMTHDEIKQLYEKSIELNGEAQ